MNAAAPTFAVDGLIAVSVGAAAIVTFTEFDTTPSNDTTVIAAEPVFTNREAGTLAVSCVGPPPLVPSACPFHCTVDPAKSPVPFTASETPASPAEIVGGATDVIRGAGFTVKFSEFEANPVGPTTRTGSVPGSATALAGTVAVNEVADPAAAPAPSGEPFNCAVAPAGKPVPLRISENDGCVAVTTAGVIEVSTSAGTTVRVNAFDVNPPGLETVTEIVPGAAMADAGTVAVTVPLLEEVVCPRLSVAPVWKPMPLAVSVNAGPPATTTAGSMLVSWNGRIVNVAVPDRDASAVTTPTVAEPAFATNAAGTCAVKVVELPNAVARPEPFQVTAEPLVKFVPETVSVNVGEPASAELGEIPIRVGAGASVSVIGTCTEVPGPETVRESRYVPAARPRVLTPTDTVEGVPPLCGVTVTGTVPPPKMPYVTPVGLDEIVINCAAGLFPPTVPANARTLGVTPKVGVDGGGGGSVADVNVATVAAVPAPVNIGIPPASGPSAIFTFNAGGEG